MGMELAVHLCAVSSRKLRNQLSASCSTQKEKAERPKIIAQLISTPSPQIKGQNKVRHNGKLVARSQSTFDSILSFIDKGLDIDTSWKGEETYRSTVVNETRNQILSQMEEWN